jgi:hypothetical protein
LLLPSSAAAERAFSIRRTSVDDQQTSTLEDRQKLDPGQVWQHDFTGKMKKGAKKTAVGD